MAVHGRVLVVEDNDAERRALAGYLKLQGHDVFAAEDADRAMGYSRESIDVVLCDVRLHGASGLDLLGLWKKTCPRTQFILITGQATVVDAVSAIKAGAYDYVTKPQSQEKLSLLVRHALEANQRASERGGAGGRGAMNGMVGQSPEIQRVFERIKRAAPVDSTVLILGENGSGKELVARALHEGSPRREGPFVAVNVAAVPASLVESELFGHVRGAFTGATDRRVGRFEQASGGTLFIDEIGDFDLALQPKLLRVLETLTLTPVGGHEDLRVNVRVVAATSRDITQMVRERQFREDLYYRLNVVRIKLPALRERVEDIPTLAEHFLREITALRAAGPRRISTRLMHRLAAYPWPGNVRELRNTLESMIVLSDEPTLNEADLPDHIARYPLAEGSAAAAAAMHAAPPLEIATMEQLERAAIFRALEESSQNRTVAARKLGISLRTLQRKLLAYQQEAGKSSDSLSAS